MNPDTLVSIHGYAGDSNQIRHNFPYYQHHRCPIVVLSPDDSAITAKDIGRPTRSVEYRTGGKKAYIGEDSLVRQRIHLEILLGYPHKWFLMHDSDSVCLTPQLPGYLYSDDPALVWSNVVSDEMHAREEGYPFPRLAFQPPYFVHRDSVRKLIAASYEVAVNATTPFIDWCMMSWCIKAGLPFRGYPDGCSCPTTHYEPGVAHMAARVRNDGATMLHSIKLRTVLLTMARHRIEFKRKQARDTRLFR